MTRPSVHILMTDITSRANPKIKQIRALQQRKQREASGLFVVEGVRHVGEAVAAGAAIDYLCYAPDLLTSDFAFALIQNQRAAGVVCYSLSSELFAEIAAKDNPQGILAVIRQKPASLSDLHPPKMNWGIAVVSPQDPGNVGAILRTMDAVGAGALILLEDSVDVYHPTSLRASMGAFFWHPVVTTSFDSFAQWAHHHGYQLVGTSAHGAVDYREVTHYNRPCILLMGSEREGLTAAQIDRCAMVVRLPMVGRVSSLNLAVATGILLYEMMDKGGQSDTTRRI